MREVNEEPNDLIPYAVATYTQGSNAISQGGQKQGCAQHSQHNENTEGDGETEEQGWQGIPCNP
jgi:hypothetical protein